MPLHLPTSDNNVALLEYQPAFSTEKVSSLREPL